MESGSVLQDRWEWANMYACRGRGVDRVRVDESAHIPAAKSYESGYGNEE